MGLYPCSQRRCTTTELSTPPDNLSLIHIFLGGAEATLWDVTNAYAQMGRSLSNNHSNDLPQEKEVQILLEAEEKTVLERDDSRKVTSEKTISEKTTSERIIPKRTISEEAISKEVISAGAAWLTLSALTEVNRPEEIDWKSIPSMQTIAWKTGTSYGFRDAWAVGVTPRYAVGVWVDVYKRQSPEKLMITP